MRVEIEPLLKEGWELNSTSTPLLTLPERPPTLVKGLERGSYTEFEFLQRVFCTPINIRTYHSKTTTLKDILHQMVNDNLKIKQNSGNNKRYLSLDEATFWRFFAMKFMANLAARGKTKHLKRDLNAKVMGYIGKNRYKV